MLRRLKQVAASLASALKGPHRSQANGVTLVSPQSWCAHAERWRSRLNCAETGASVVSSGFHQISKSAMRANGKIAPLCCTTRAANRLPAAAACTAEAPPRRAAM